MGSTYVGVAHDFAELLLHVTMLTYNVTLLSGELGVTYALHM